MFLAKEAVRLALPGHAEAVACDGCPPLARPVSSTPTAADACSSVPSVSAPASWTGVSSSQTAQLGGASPLWEWIGDHDATVFSY
jgi:hypothetical protein